MFLTIDAHGWTGGPAQIDLTGLYDDNEAVNAGALHTLLIIRLAQGAIRRGVGFDDITPLFIYDQSIWETPDISKAISVGDVDGWIKEVAQLAWHIEAMPSWGDTDQVYAYLNDCHWQYIDFDKLEDEVSENYHSEFDGDYEDFAREWMSNFGEGDLPDHLQSHFDYHSYGEELVEGFSQLEWNDRTFLYNQ